MSKNIHIDRTLFLSGAALLVFGITMVSSVSFPYSLKNFGNVWYYAIHQLIAVGAGIVLGFSCLKISLNSFRKYSQFILLMSFFATLLVFFPGVGFKIGGARRWLRLPFFSLQPSEFLKISFFIYLAAWLSKRNNATYRAHKKILPKTGSVATLAAFVVILVALTILLMVQPDMSTFLIIVATALATYFVSKTPLWHTFLVLLAVGGLVIILALFSPYRFSRITSFLHPFADPLGRDYQFHQAQIAIGSGKIFGNQGFFSLGMSQQKFGFLPSSMSDSIFAIIGEETGFVGSCFLIFLFLIFSWRGFKISMRAKSEFAKLLGFSITFWFIFQAIMNMGGINGLLPIAGIPLPFISYGGSHIISEMIGLGILLNISREAGN